MAPEPAPPSTNAELLERIGTAWEALQQTVWGLSPQELTEARPPDRWSVKDHLAHVALWEASLLALLEGRDRAAAIGLSPAEGEGRSVDSLNALLYDRNKDRSLADVEAMLHQTHTEVLEALEKLSDADLTRPYSHFLPNAQPPDQRPIIGWIVGNTYEHFEEHTATIAAMVTSRRETGP